MVAYPFEIGHHVNGHTRDYQVYKSGARNLPTLAKKREELEADEYSGFVMQKLGATLEQHKQQLNYMLVMECYLQYSSQ